MTTTIIAGQAASFTVAVAQNGAAVAIDAGATVTGQLFAADGKTALAAPKTLSSGSPANWAAGVVALSFTNLETAGLPLGEAVLTVTATNPVTVKRFRVLIQSAAATAPVASQLFIRDIIVDELRADRLVLAAGLLPGVAISDDFLWQKVLAAESEVAHALRVPLVPTRFFPGQPTQAQIDALAGMPWAIDPGYDYRADSFWGDAWGFLKLRNKPLVSIETMTLVYPAPAVGLFTIPADWIRTDNRYATVQLVPSAVTASVPLASMIAQAIAGGRTIPFMMQIVYTAGLNAAADYPELLDVIKQLAALKVAEASFPATSGSISADGLSQSSSVDMASYRDVIDTALYGPKGSEGGLMTAIHGVRSVVLG